MPYCATTDVQKKVQNTTFTLTTQPSTTQIDAFCEEISDEMDVRMQACSVTIPVVNPDKLEYLRLIATHGVLAIVYRTISVETDKSGEYQRLYDKALEAICKNPSIINGQAAQHNGPTRTGVDYEPTLKKNERNW